MENNLDKPTEAQAASIARLAQNIGAIEDPSVRAFVERVAARVAQLEEAAQEEAVIFISDPNEKQKKNV